MTPRTQTCRSKFAASLLTLLLSTATEQTSTAQFIVPPVTPHFSYFYPSSCQCLLLPLQQQWEIKISSSSYSLFFLLLWLLYESSSLPYELSTLPPPTEIKNCYSVVMINIHCCGLLVPIYCMYQYIGESASSCAWSICIVSNILNVCYILITSLTIYIFRPDNWIVWSLFRFELSVISFEFTLLFSNGLSYPVCKFDIYQPPWCLQKQKLTSSLNPTIRWLS